MVSEQFPLIALFLRSYVNLLSEGQCKVTPGEYFNDVREVATHSVHSVSRIQLQ